MKNRHRVSQVVSKLVCLRAARRKILKAGRMSNGWSMSALPPKADIRPRDQDVRFGPITDIGRNPFC